MAVQVKEEAWKGWNSIEIEVGRCCELSERLVATHVSIASAKITMHVMG